MNLFLDALSLVNSAGRNLRATERFSLVSFALQTTPIPLLPGSDRILYLPAMVLPEETKGVCRVLVTETGANSLPHFLQKLESSGFLVLHLGHFMVITKNSFSLASQQILDQHVRGPILDQFLT